MLSFSSSLYEGIVNSALRERQQNLENKRMRKGGNREKGAFRSALRVEYGTNHATDSYEHHSNRPELKLLASRSLRLSVLNLTTPHTATETLTPEQPPSTSS